MIAVVSVIAVNNLSCSPYCTSVMEEGESISRERCIQPTYSAFLRWVIRLCLIFVGLYLINRK